MRSGKEGGNFERVDFFEHRSRFGIERGEFVARSRVGFVHFADKFGERLQIFHATQKRNERRNGGFERGVFGNHALRRLLVVPKIRLRHFGLQLGNAILLRGNVKKLIKMPAATHDFVNFCAGFRRNIHSGKT